MQNSNQPRANQLVPARKPVRLSPADQFAHIKEMSKRIPEMKLVFDSVKNKTNGEFSGRLLEVGGNHGMLTCMFVYAGMDAYCIDLEEGSPVFLEELGDRFIQGDINNPPDVLKGMEFDFVVSTNLMVPKAMHTVLRNKWDQMTGSNGCFDYRVSLDVSFRKGIEIVINAQLMSIHKSIAKFLKKGGIAIHTVAREEDPIFIGNGDLREINLTVEAGLDYFVVLKKI